MTTLSFDIDSDVLCGIVRISLLESYKDLVIHEPDRSDLIKSYQDVIKDYSTPNEWHQFVMEESNG